MSPVISPELTIDNVWIHVYCWGLLIFVSLYCLSGVYMPGSCWFAFGMLALCIDELIAAETSKYMVVTVNGLLLTSVVCVWWGLVGIEAKNQTISEVLVGVCGPALGPFVFFSVRTNVRNALRDIPRLFEFALPFVLCLSVFIMATTSREDFFLRRSSVSGGRFGQDGVR